MRNDRSLVTVCGVGGFYGGLDHRIGCFEVFFANSVPQVPYRGKEIRTFSRLQPHLLFLHPSLTPRPRALGAPCLSNLHVINIFTHTPGIPCSSVSIIIWKNGRAGGNTAH